MRRKSVALARLGEVLDALKSSLAAAAEPFPPGSVGGGCMGDGRPGPQLAINLSDPSRTL
jgi:hypothetical protein